MCKLWKGLPFQFYWNFLKDPVYHYTLQETAKWLPTQFGLQFLSHRTRIHLSHKSTTLANIGLSARGLVKPIYKQKPS